MKLNRGFRSLVIALCCVMTTAAQTVYAAGPVAVRPAVNVQDVALAQGGVLRGQAMDAEGRLLVGAKVTVARGAEIVGEAITDQNGEFAVSGLNGGMYQISTGETGGAYRLWSPNTAPPAAHSQALVVGGNDVVRGNLGGGGLAGGLLQSPWFWGAVVAAAIAIPLALDDDAS